MMLLNQRNANLVREVGRVAENVAKQRFELELDDYSEAHDVSMDTARREMTSRYQELVDEEMAKRFVPSKVVSLEETLKGLAISVLMRQLNELKTDKQSAEIDDEIETLTDEELDLLEGIDFGAFA